MEDDLVMNRLPYPKNFDGEQWNTVIKPSRKYIPKYLHQDLPQLKHLYIKDKFKEIGKFNCPKLQYFNNIIKSKKNNKKAVSATKAKSFSKNKKHIGYNQIKQQLQYALIIGDKDSNIVENLLEKAKSVQQKDTNQSIRQIRKKKKRMSENRDMGKYFSNTVDLVFKNRKKQYLSSLKQKQEIQIGDAQQKINSIKLIDYDN